MFSGSRAEPAVCPPGPALQIISVKLRQSEGKISTELSTTTPGHSSPSPASSHLLLLGLQRLQRLHELVGEGGPAGAVHRLDSAGGSGVGLGLLHCILPSLDAVLDGGRPHLGKIKDLDSITSISVRVTEHRGLLSADHPPGVVVDGVEAGEVVPTFALDNPPVNIFQLNDNNIVDINMKYEYFYLHWRLIPSRELLNSMV